MKSWKIREHGAAAGRPEILSSSSDARAIVIALPEGQSLDDHEVHERAWLTVIEGEVAVTAGRSAAAGDPRWGRELAP